MSNENNGKINILDLRDSPWVDGPGRTILETAARIDKSKFRIVIGGFSSGDSREDDYIKEAKNKNLDVVIIRETRSLDPGVLGQLKSIVQQYDIHIIHTHEFRSNLYGLMCAKKNKIPIVVTLHGYIANDLKGRIYRLLDKLLIRFFDEITTVSKKLQSQLKESFIPEKRIAVINNALIIDRYQIKREGNTLREELGLSGDCVLIASIGRLSPEKGQEIFLRASKDVIDENSETVLLIIGIGSEEGRLKELAKQLGISSNVLFIGFRKDMLNVYNGIDLVVQSSYTEGMPNVILESLLMEIPVIATDVGGTSEIVANKVNGILIEPGSVTEIQVKILEFFKQREFYKTMAKRGKLDIAEKFNFDMRTRQQMDIYHKMIK